MEIAVLSDTELISRARQFDRQTLAQIYDLYSPRLYRYAMRLLGDQNLAEDCVAETFSRFLQALRACKGPDNFLQAYLFRTAHNWIADQYRRQPIPTIELDEQHPDGNANPEEEAGLRKALRHLTPDQQQVIALKFFEEWENEEIAYAMRKPVGAVKSLQHRALASLQRILLNEELV